MPRWDLQTAQSRDTAGMQFSSWLCFRYSEVCSTRRVELSTGSSGARRAHRLGAQEQRQIGTAEAVHAGMCGQPARRGNRRLLSRNRLLREGVQYWE